jgi:hypothetical protein
MMASDTFGHAISRMRADPALRQAFESDPWLALACDDLVRDGQQRQLVSGRPPDISPESGPHDRQSQAWKGRAAA